jgi:tetratricopeptide (TPR) repeat protein
MLKHKSWPVCPEFLNIAMTADELVALGNASREQDNPEQALAYYAQAFVTDRNNSHAFNNYGNVLRELGDPAGAVPFLQRAITLDPMGATPKFNLAVAHLLQGNCEQGWAQYENRWNFEHMSGTLPDYEQPRWSGQELKDKTILVIGEQGHGDNIQFVRFLWNLHERGAKIILQVNDNVAPLLAGSRIINKIIDLGPVTESFDYWIPIMSLPGVLGVTIDNLARMQNYISADEKLYRAWLQHLGPKHRLRVGFCWSGRRDTWINRYKGMSVDDMISLIKRNPNYDWINLQLDASAEDTQKLIDAGVVKYSLPIKNFADSAALIATLDVVVTVDTAVAHLSASLGRPTWIMLGNHAVDWRWLLNRDTCPWYLTAKLFRQQQRGDWSYPLEQVDRYLKLFKI